MARTLEPEDEISHYRIVGPLGAGGMGEVYAARDETLGRSVALKILPPDLVRNDERVRRFVTEARSASSLNHPNIVTIYEIGRDVLRPAAKETARPTAAPPDDPIYFIAMELVAGATLDRAIHHDRAELRSVVGWLAQAAEGIAKAHAAGIVHRDLKPGNIMISRDGFAKVLDFGLAKLTEKAAATDADRTSMSTAAANTGAGAVMGTVGYMSPEQVQGKPVDHRSDIFSLGCILYEAATGQRPFAADSDVEVMHRILKEPPEPMETLNPSVPGELRRVVRRCLAKSPDQRFQSMKDVAIELREMFETWDTLSPSHPSAGSGAPGAAVSGAAAVARGGRGLWAAMAAAALLGVGGLGFGLVTLMRHGAPGAASPPAAPNLRISVLMSLQGLHLSGVGSGTGSALSADGRYLAYSTTRDRTSSLKVRQVRTGSDVVIVADSEQLISGVQFSRDGDYLFYIAPDPKAPSYRALFQVPSLGGTPRKILYDVDSAPTFSPDGKRACFRRGLLGSAEDSLVIADLNGGGEREILRIRNPSEIVAAPDWSPDGASIAVAIQNTTGGVKTTIEILDVASGRHAPLGTRHWIFIQSVRWMPDGSSVLASAFDFDGGGARQIYRVAYPGGDTVRLTTDLDGYSDLSVAADGSSVAAVRNVTVDNIWAARLGSGWNAQAVTSVTGSSGSVQGLVPLPRGTTAYTAPLENKLFLWEIGTDGSNRRQITTEGVFVINASYGQDAGIVFSRVDAGEEVTAHLWRVDPDGGGLRQITSGQGETMLELARTGGVVLYERWNDPHSIWLASVAGGTPRRIVDGKSIDGTAISPDGSRVMYTRLEKTGDKMREVKEIVDLNGGPVQSLVDLPPGAARVGWTPDGRGVTYIDRSQGWNLIRKSFPDGPAEPLTRFTDGQVSGYSWSRDGAWLAFERRVGQQDSLWMLKAGENRPMMVTEFKGGQIRYGLWAPDAPVFYFVYGNSTQDVVLLNGIR